MGFPNISDFWAPVSGDKAMPTTESGSVKDSPAICGKYSFYHLGCCISTVENILNQLVTPLTPNDPYSGHTAPLNSKRCIIYIYSTNIITEYFKHGIYSPLFSLQNSVCFVILTYLVPVLFTFYIQDVLKLKKIIMLISP